MELKFPLQSNFGHSHISTSLNDLLRDDVVIDDLFVKFKHHMMSVTESMITGTVSNILGLCHPLTLLVLVEFP